MSTGAGQYRRLLRSVKFAFGQDVRALKLARVQLKQEFVKSKHVVDPKVLTTLYKDVDDIDEMLRFHIVQGKRTEKGNYEVALKPEHQATIANEQDRQYGPELTPIDPTYVGAEIGVTKVKPCGSKKLSPQELGDVTKM